MNLLAPILERQKPRYRRTIKRQPFTEFCSELFPPPTWKSELQKYRPPCSNKSQLPFCLVLRNSSVNQRQAGQSFFIRKESWKCMEHVAVYEKQEVPHLSTTKCQHQKPRFISKSLVHHISLNEVALSGCCVGLWPEDWVLPENNTRADGLSDRRYPLS